MRGWLIPVLKYLVGHSIGKGFFLACLIMSVSSGVQRILSISDGLSELSEPAVALLLDQSPPHVLFAAANTI